MKEKISKYHSILQTLFIPYILLFILSHIMISVFFVTFYCQKIRDDAFDSIENNLITVSDTLDTQIGLLDTLSQNVIYSNLVKDSFSSYLHYELELSSPEEVDTYSNNQNTKVLYDLLFAIIGPNHPADQIYLYGISGGTFGVGLDNSTSGNSVSEKSWYDDTVTLNGKKNIFVEADETISPYYAEPGGAYFLSLTRVFYDVHNNPQGIVEVKKNFSEFVSLVNSLNYPDDAEIYIFDDNGNVIYPFTSSRSSTECYTMIKEADGTPGTANCISASPDYYFYYRSSSTGFTTAVSINRYALYSSVFKYILSSLFALLLVCILVIAVSYFIAHRISKPIKNMYIQIHGFRLNEHTMVNAEIVSEDTNILELKALYDALINMQHKVQHSVQRELQLQQRENQAKMLALQAQMNPHFLFNSLAVIQALSDEKRNDTINIFCRNISNILRYISSDDEQLVVLEKEILHTENYLQCMKIRYGADLAYSIQIPEEMNNLKIPKLCLQMLAENAIKYSTKVRAPWNIEITGYVTGTGWKIEIRDNGPGFSEEALALLTKNMEEIQNSEIYPSLKIDGMGLMNTFIRFKILYNGKQLFQVKNHEPRGAVVTIGGLL